jgi:hypothetical protein
MLDQTKLSRLVSGQLPQHRPLKPLPPACLELRFCGFKGRRASIAAQAERLSQDAIQRPRPPQGVSAIAKLMDPAHRPFAAENSVIDTVFADRRDEVCLMIGQRHRSALALCCARFADRHDPHDAAFGKDVMAPKNVLRAAPRFRSLSGLIHLRHRGLQVSFALVPGVNHLLGTRNGEQPMA